LIALGLALGIGRGVQGVDISAGELGPLSSGKINSIYVAAASAARIGAVSAEISRALPKATVTNYSDLASEVTGSLARARSARAAAAPRAAGGGFRRFAASAAHTVAVHLTAPVTAGAIVAAVLLAIAGGLIAGTVGGWRAARLRPAAALARVE
jgi:hypothetical protein